MPMFNSLSTFISQFNRCQLCGLDRGTHATLCQECWQNLPWCHQSFIRQELSIHAACAYQYPISNIIQKFKYEEKLHFQTLLSAALNQLKIPKVHALVPMPISQERLVERGYNQALLLAQHLSKELNIPIWQPIYRVHEHHQKGLNRLERLTNLEDQFKAHRQQRVIYRKVLIIDDVVTTGSSVRALHDALLQLGCKQVHVACVAIATESELNLENAVLPKE